MSHPYLNAIVDYDSSKAARQSLRRGRLFFCLISLVSLIGLQQNGLNLLNL